MDLKRLKNIAEGKPANDQRSERLEKGEQKESRMQSIVNIYNLAVQKLDYEEQKILRNYNTKWPGKIGHGKPWQEGFFMHLEANESKFRLMSIEAILRELKSIFEIGKDDKSANGKQLAAVGSKLWTWMDRKKSEYKPGSLNKEVAEDEKNISDKDGAETLKGIGKLVSWERILFCIYNIRRQILEVMGFNDGAFERKYGHLYAANDNALATNDGGSSAEPAQRILKKATHAAGEQMADLDPETVVAPTTSSASAELQADTQEQVTAATVVDLHEAGNPVVANDTMQNTGT